MVPVEGVKPGVENSTLTFRLPQAGLGLRLFVIISGTLTVTSTSISGGTWKSGFESAPYGFVKNMRFGNNQSVLLRDLSGTGWYIHTRSRYGFDPLRGANAYFSSTNSGGTVLGLGTANQPVAGAAITNGTYNYQICLPVDMAYNQMGENGLLVLQSNNVFYDLVLSFGQGSTGVAGAGPFNNDFVSALAGVNVQVTHTFSAKVGMQYLDMLPPEMIQAQLSTAMTVSETVQTGLFQGDNSFSLPPQDWYTKIDVQTFNNGNAIAANGITKQTLQYNGQITDINQDQQMNTAVSYYDHNGVPPMDGVTTYDFGLRRGVMNRRDTLDAFANNAVTDAKIVTTVGISPTGVNGQRFVLEGIRQLVK
jgi:hypothetical protein